MVDYYIINKQDNRWNIKKDYNSVKYENEYTFWSSARNKIVWVQETKNAKETLSKCLPWEDRKQQSIEET